MTTYETNWSREEFKAYLMLNCANADYIETDTERELILSKVDKEIYKHIHKEFDKDNDYVRLQKIANTAKRYGYTKNKAHVLLSRMKNLFMKDHDLGVMEEYMFKGLKRILT
ncbi:MAG TPA: hypothetical protein EYG85_08555 [Crocinitomix sp.]|nr:hypothetical protein [Crocinitomix sp.]